MLCIDDGYTLPVETTPTVLGMDGVTTVYSGLPVVRGLYRPPTWEEKQAMNYKAARTANPEEYIQLMAEWVVSRLASWDVEMRAEGKTVSAPLEAKYVRKLPEPVFNMLLDKVSMWGPRGTQGASAGNS